MKTTWRSTIRQGLLAGALGFLTVAIVFAVANIAAGRSPWHTAGMLGAVLFGGVADPARLPVTWANVMAYSGLHVAVFLAFGVLGAWLADLAERGWQLWFVGSFFFLFVSFHLEAAVQAVAAPMRSTIPAAAIWGTGLAATLVMGAYILSRHPRIRAGQPW